MLDTSWWSAHDIPAKLLGTYEAHIVDRLVALSKSRKTLIDVGAADGHLAVGALKAGLFDRAICFEISEDGRNRLRETAQINGMLERVQIEAEATVETLAAQAATAKDAVVLIDIEGAEFDVLSSDALRSLARFPVIVELHDMFLPNLEGARDALIRRAEPFFELANLRPGPISPHDYPIIADLPDQEKYLCFCEYRPKSMEWLEFTSR